MPWVILNADPLLIPALCNFHYPFPTRLSTEAFIVCKGFHLPPEMQGLLDKNETSATEVNLLQAFTELRFEDSLPAISSRSGEAGQLESERAKAVGWVGGGDLR
jgi:hypothetical protein